MTHLGGAPQMNLVATCIVMNVEATHRLSTEATGVCCVARQDLRPPARPTDLLGRRAGAGTVRVTSWFERRH